jgi:hypothetical protein
VNKTPFCAEALRREVVAPRAYRDPTNQALEYAANEGTILTRTRQFRRTETVEEKVAYSRNLSSQSGIPVQPNRDPIDTESAGCLADDDASGTNQEDSEANQELGSAFGSYGNNFGSPQTLFREDEQAGGQVINDQMRKDFQAYCASHRVKFLPLKKEEVTSIKLLDTMKRKKSPLNAYPELLEWHLKETKHLLPHETLKDTTKYFHRSTLMNRLTERYNVEAMLPKTKRLTLPYSKAVVTIPYRSACDCIVSLLTDPRAKDAKYLFFNQDPLSPPPEKLVYLQDLNTGDAYLRSHESLITKENQVLLPIIFYIDGAVTGQFSDLPVTALKMSLGIFDRETRDKDWAWRELAWIPQVRKEFARGKKLFQESNHLESQDIVLLDGEGLYADSSDEGTESDEEGPELIAKAQDFHTMLSFALQSFVKLQETGFVWDQVAYGKLTKAIEYVPFVVNVKCDTEEGDLLCGKYTSRTQNVKHICRYCHCPTHDADNPNARYPSKTPKEIQRLVNKGKLDQLRAISQQNIQNAWYNVRFHTATEQGIHGACPSEMLHAILLGIFKYLRSIFFQHMGEESLLAQDINGLAQMYGLLLTHQSDRDLPYTNFGKGIQKGKLMAKQYRGVMLVMAAVVRSTAGRAKLMKKKKFGRENGLRDWTLLLELMLEWEAYLCEKKMRKSDVKRLAKKHRYIMYIIRNVAKRKEGMGLKFMKFHAIIHLVEDMLLYGTPSEFDTGSNESHHKETKQAAKLTQRKEATFNYQTAKRMTEFLVLDLAMEEVKHGKVVWEYFKNATEEDWEYLGVDEEHDVPETAGIPSQLYVGSPDLEQNASQSGTSVANESGSHVSDSDDEELVVTLRGTQIKVFEDRENGNEPSFTVLGKSLNKNKSTWINGIVDFLVDLQKKVIQYLPVNDLPIFTEQKRGNCIFRGHPNFAGNGPWKDWAIVDWGPGWGRLPSHIWCFVDLTAYESPTKNIEYGGIRLEPLVYAVVEVANYDDIDDDLGSDLFVPLTLDVESVDNDNVTGRKFFLADTDAIVGPCIVVPDIGGKPNAYFQVKKRTDWAQEFVHWLRDKHSDDQMVVTDAESSNK